MVGARARTGRATLAAMVVLLAAAVSFANAETIKVTANNCSDIGSAFAQLSRTYNTTTRSSPITLQVTLACTGNFVCDADPKATFVAGNAPTKNGKQPNVNIKIASDPKCRRAYLSRPLIDTTDAALASDLTLISLIDQDKQEYPGVIISLSFTGVDFAGKEGQSAVRFNAHPNTSSKLTMTVRSKGSWVKNARVCVDGVATVAIASGTWTKAPSTPILELSRIAKTVTIKDIEFNERFPNAGNTSSVSITKLAPAAKVTITNSVFNMDRPDDSAYSLLLEYDSNVAATLTRNLFMNGALNQTAVCIRSLAPGGKPPAVSLAGTTGLSPTKAPWPVTGECSVASLKRTGS